MKRLFLFLLCGVTIALVAVTLMTREPVSERNTDSEVLQQKKKLPNVIDGRIKEGENLFVIFKNYGLSLSDLFQISEASASVHPLSDVITDHRYEIKVDDDNRVCAFTYWMDDDFRMEAVRGDGGFEAEKKKIRYDKKIAHIGISIRDNLVSSLPSDREKLSLALDLSDIFAWDLDFASDLREGDLFKIVVEKDYRKGEFKKYGKILCAEYIGTNGKTLSAYRFESGGKACYYDGSGRPLKKAFLKAPLSFRRISSGYSSRRLNPVLRIHRPHNGIDYAAPAGTPVSAVGSGTVSFAGRKGGYGNLIIVRHRNGYSTYYGHLSRIGKGIRRHAKVVQGQAIGYVGSTGISTGPHLHFEIRVHGNPVNPVLAKIPRVNPLSGERMARFRDVKRKMDGNLAAIYLPEAESDGTT